MDNLSIESDQNQDVRFNVCESTKCINSSHTVTVFKVLQTLRKDEVLCDVRLKTDDGAIVFGHKIVLVSASPYFRAMLNSFDENNSNLVNITELDSTILQLLIDYIYSGEIMINDDNVQDLLPAANILQLHYVSVACAQFLQTQLSPSNCFGIKSCAELNNCTELLSSSEQYIKKQFLEVVKCNEFLSLSLEDVIKCISSNDLAVPLEENVFECVMKWVKHDLDCREDYLPELMNHVRLPLLTPNVLNKVVEEPLLQNIPNYKDYVHEALRFSLLKSVQHFTVPQTIRSKPRQSGGLQKVILIFKRSKTVPMCYTEWYDPATKLQKKAPEMKDCRFTAGLGIIRDQFVFALGGVNNSSSKTVNLLDLSSQSPCWVPMVDMLISRKNLSVGVLNDCLYAVGGYDGKFALDSVEVFDVGIQKWRMVSSMSTERTDFGVGVINNHLYAVGGSNGYEIGKVCLKSVEYYDPTFDTWTSVKNMSQSRLGVSVGVIDGIIYAFGGYCNGSYLKSAEAYNPNAGVWSPISDLHFPRYNAGVVTLDGLLYVLGGRSGDAESTFSDSIEIYNPITNTWIIEPLPRKDINIYGGIVVDRPSHFITH